MLSISGAISVPFVLVALNQDRIAAFFNKYGDRIPWKLASVLLGAVIMISVLWTQDLASGIKAAVTAFLIIIITVAFAAPVIYNKFSSMGRVNNGNDISG
ncbi:hypothetical protein NHQ30_010775 [Ciborinia camelliae]|nr:hypothetical protein NHQ30_010775 [Ciborinia camelliae]